MASDLILIKSASIETELKEVDGTKFNFDEINGKIGPNWNQTESWPKSWWSSAKFWWNRPQLELNWKKLMERSKILTSEPSWMTPEVNQSRVKRPMNEYLELEHKHVGSCLSNEWQNHRGVSMPPPPPKTVFSLIKTTQSERVEEQKRKQLQLANQRAGDGAQKKQAAQETEKRKKERERERAEVKTNVEMFRWQCGCHSAGSHPAAVKLFRTHRSFCFWLLLLFLLFFSFCQPCQRHCPLFSCSLTNNHL